MNIIQRFESLASNNPKILGIGLGTDIHQNDKILTISSKFAKSKNATIFLFGDENAQNLFSKKMNSLLLKEKIQLIKSDTPSKTIVEYLKENKINAIIRGALSSSKFLQQVKTQFKIDQIKRLALLETHEGYQFFYGPVGIDECHDFDSKIQFIEAAMHLMSLLKIIPKVSILSGGREDDIGRMEAVDTSIREALAIVDYFKKNVPSLSLTHDHILIENAIKNKANLIIAPEGISGNLIYRTLVHLGGGKAHGAIYMGLNKPIIDTSRVGHSSEIEGALLMASAFLP